MKQKQHHQAAPSPRSESPFPSHPSSTILYEFKIRYTLMQRTLETDEVRIRVPDKVPVIMEEVCENSWLPALSRRKLLLPRQMTAGQLIHLLRARLYIRPCVPLLVLMGEHVVQVTDLVGHIYDQLHDEDGFLYVAYSPYGELSGPKRFLRVPPSPPPPPTTPNSSVDVQSPRSSARKTRGGKHLRQSHKDGQRKTMRRGGSKHSVDKSQKSVSREGSLKRHASKKGSANADEDGDRKKSKSVDRKGRESRKSPTDMGVDKKKSQMERASSMRPKRDTSTKPRASAKVTKPKET